MQVKNIWLGCCAPGPFTTIWGQPEVPFTCIGPIPLNCALHNSAFGLQVRVISSHTLDTCKSLCDIKSGIDPHPLRPGHEKKMPGLSKVPKPTKWQDPREEGKNGRNALQTAAKINFGEKKMGGGVRGTLFLHYNVNETTKNLPWLVESRESTEFKSHLTESVQELCEGL